MKKPRAGDTKVTNNTIEKRPRVILICKYLPPPHVVPLRQTNHIHSGPERPSRSLQGHHAPTPHFRLLEEYMNINYKVIGTGPSVLGTLLADVPIPYSHDVTVSHLIFPRHGYSRRRGSAWQIKIFVFPRVRHDVQYLTLLPYLQAGTPPCFVSDRRFLCARPVSSSVLGRCLLLPCHSTGEFSVLVLGISTESPLTQHSSVFSECPQTR